MSTIVQRIGSRGTFTLSSPYDTLIISDAIYIVVDMGMITTMMRRVPALTSLVYEQVGRSTEDANLDIGKKITIVVLEDVAGRFFYIPEYAFESIAKNNGKYYQHTVLSVEMGAHTDDIDLTHLKQAISDDVYNYFGVTPRIKDFKTSDKRMLEEDAHQEIITRRALAKQDSSNYRLLLTETLAREEQLKQTNEELQKFILDNFNPPEEVV